MITAIIAALIKPFAAMAGLLFARWDAKRDAEREAALVEAEAKSRDLERMHDAQIALGDDPAVLRDWLHTRAHK